MKLEALLENLIARARGGDEIALKVLLTRTRWELSRFLAAKIPHDCRQLFDVDDIVQLAHISIFHDIQQIRSTHPENFRRWTKAIALNRLRNAICRYRAAKRDVARNRPGNAMLGSGDSTISLLNTLSSQTRRASQHVARAEAISMMEVAMARLPRHYRVALRLVYLDGLRVSDAAAVMGKTDRAIHGLCRRALKLLEAELGSVSGYLSSTT